MSISQIKCFVYETIQATKIIQTTIFVDYKTQEYF
jgi:hypothetical protein